MHPQTIHNEPIVHPSSKTSGSLIVRDVVTATSDTMSNSP